MDYPRILGESFFYFPFQINSLSSKNEIHGRVFRIGGDPLSPNTFFSPKQNDRKALSKNRFQVNVGQTRKRGKCQERRSGERREGRHGEETERISATRRLDGIVNLGRETFEF